MFRITVTSILFRLINYRVNQYFNISLFFQLFLSRIIWRSSKNLIDLFACLFLANQGWKLEGQKFATLHIDAACE